jgi:hypothetical protein
MKNMTLSDLKKISVELKRQIAVIKDRMQKLRNSTSAAQVWGTRLATASNAQILGMTKKLLQNQLVTIPDGIAAFCGHDPEEDAHNLSTIELYCFELNSLKAASEELETFIQALMMISAEINEREAEQAIEIAVISLKQDAEASAQ